MATLFCKWTPSEQAKAVAYEAECTAQYRIAASLPSGKWALVREDKNGNWTVPLLGPPWSWDGVSSFPEPASCLALRVDAVVVETPEWPVVEEE